MGEVTRDFSVIRVCKNRHLVFGAIFCTWLTSICSGRMQTATAPIRDCALTISERAPQQQCSDREENGKPQHRLDLGQALPVRAWEPMHLYRLDQKSLNVNEQMIRRKLGADISQQTVIIFECAAQAWHAHKLRNSTPAASHPPIRVRVPRTHRRKSARAGVVFPRPRLKRNKLHSVETMSDMDLGSSKVEKQQNRPNYPQKTAFFCDFLAEITAVDILVLRNCRAGPKWQLQTMQTPNRENEIEGHFRGSSEYPQHFVKKKQKSSDFDKEFTLNLDIFFFSGNSSFLGSWICKDRFYNCKEKKREKTYVTVNFHLICLKVNAHDSARDTTLLLRKLRASILGPFVPYTSTSDKQQNLYNNTQKVRYKLQNKFLSIQQQLADRVMLRSQKLRNFRRTKLMCWNKHSYWIHRTKNHFVILRKVCIRLKQKSWTNQRKLMHYFNVYFYISDRCRAIHRKWDKDNASAVGSKESEQSGLETMSQTVMARDENVLVPVSKIEGPMHDESAAGSVLKTTPNSIESSLNTPWMQPASMDGGLSRSETVSTNSQTRFVVPIGPMWTGLAPTDDGSRCVASVSMQSACLERIRRAPSPQAGATAVNVCISRVQRNIKTAESKMTERWTSLDLKDLLELQQHQAAATMQSLTNLTNVLQLAVVLKEQDPTTKHLQLGEATGGVAQGEATSVSTAAHGPGPPHRQL